MFSIVWMLACGEKDPTITNRDIHQEPKIVSIQINPSAVYTSTEIACVVETEDADTEVLEIQYRWHTVDGVDLGQESVLRLTPTMVQPTQEILCTVEVSDGESTVQDSVSSTILNTEPVVTNAEISPNRVLVDTELHCAFEATDADEEELQANIAWQSNGNILANTADLLLEPSLVRKGDEILCLVDVEDGYGGIASMVASAFVENSPPSIASVELLPENPSSQDVITCSPLDAYDIDDDALEFRYMWWIDGVEQPNTEPTFVGATVGQTVRCAIIPNDGVVDGESKDASVVVVNTAPEISHMEILPGVGVQADSLLECVVTANDVDGEETTTTVLWESTTVLGTESTLQLAPSFISVGTEVSCTATVTDIHGDAVENTVTVTVENTEPTCSVYPAISGIALTNSTLSCTGEVVDLNDGILSTSTVWTLANGSVLGNSATLVIDANQTDVGDELFCTVTGVDTQGASISASTSIVVENTLPMVDGISLSSAQVYTEDTITATAIVSDVDTEQSVSPLFTWHVVDAGQDNIVQTGTEASLDGQWFDKGAQVYVEVTAFDGVEYGGSLASGMVDVLNTVPSAVTLEISPALVRLEMDSVTCAIGTPSVDIDGDVIVYQYDWLDAMGQNIQSIQTTSLLDTLSPSVLSSVVSVPQSLTCQVTAFDGEEYGAPTVVSVDTEFDCNCPQTTERDFAFTYWPENFRYPNFNLYGFYTERHFVTGYYGAVMDMSNGSLLHLAPISHLTMQEAALSDDSWMLAGLDSAVSYAVEINGMTYGASLFVNPTETGAHSADNPSMLMDMGRFQQHIEIPEVWYQGNTDILGSVGIVSAPQHLVITHRMASAVEHNGSITISVTLSGDLWTQSQVSLIDGTRAMEVIDGDGATWVLIAPTATDSVSQAGDGSIVVSRTVGQLLAGEEISIPMLLLPADEITSAQVLMYLEPENTVQVTYAQLNQVGSMTTAIENANWDWERGAFTVPLGSIRGSGASSNSANWGNGIDANIYNRHQIEISHASVEALHVPLFLDGPINTTFNITGGSPLFRNLNQEPTGLAIQVSKNWHLAGYWPNWFHMYSTPSVPMGTHPMELTIAIGKWGETFAASHAQLSLVGWGANQQWDESALGAWGESITYDPDKTLRRAMVDDVRPFLVDVSGQYNWTGNVGGADFLKYVDVATPWREQQPTQLKSVYTAPGPVMTDVRYAGITTDDAIAFSVDTHLVRTDDLVRAYYVLHYEIREDIEYARLALFQIAADNYSDNGFSTYAYGDSTGVIFDGIVPTHNTTGYASVADRGIALQGNHPWVFLYDNQRTGGNLPENFADVAFVVRDYAAVLNGVYVTDPHININRTNNGGWSQMAFELGVPFDPTNTVIEAGSTIDAIVEYLVIPHDIASYYGPSTDMANVDSSFFGTTDIIELLAMENSITVVSSVGVVEQQQPTIITGVTDSVAAQFLLSGGFGYSPITIQGLFRPDGWQLQFWDNGVWVHLDQSVHGNDYWQTRWDEESETYALTFSVDIDAPTEFRLVLQ